MSKERVNTARKQAKARLIQGLREGRHFSKDTGFWHATKQAIEKNKGGSRYVERTQ